VSNPDEAWGFETRAIHVGQEPDETTGAITVPIHLATTFVQPAPGQHRGYEYSRTSNPTRAALERSVAGLEGARHGFAFASGMAAEDALVGLLRPGDHVVLGLDAYGGTFRLIARVYGERGHRVLGGGPDRPRGFGRRAAARDPAGVGRDADQPHADRGRHRRGG